MVGNKKAMEKATALVKEKAAAPSGSQKLQLTREQTLAIHLTGKNLLVSAGAGAGKTHVLVERVIHFLTRPDNPVDIDRMLVVTFTDAAAQEMRERIGRRLEAALEEDSGNRHLARQLALVNGAHISTLHSFCTRLLRKYFYRLDLDPAFRVADEDEAALLRDEVVTAVLEDRFSREGGDGPVTDLARRYSGQRGGDEALAKLILEIYAFSQSKVSPRRWFDQIEQEYRRAADPSTDIDELSWTRFVQQDVALQLEAAADDLETALEAANLPEGPAPYAPTITSELESVKAAIATAFEGGWDEMQLALVAADNFQRLPRVSKDMVNEDLKERCAKYRNSAKKTIRGIRGLYTQQTVAELRADISEVKDHVGTLISLVTDFEDRYSASKAGQRALDFDDLQRLALELLLADDSDPERPSPVALELQDHFEEIFVDEYQDINGMQDAILRLVSRQGRDNRESNLFMVGDVKQSIYRFRLADPTIFLSKYNSYPVAGDQAHQGPLARVDLSKNFRSRSGILDAVNYIFRHLFVEKVAELDYPEEAELRFGAGYYGDGDGDAESQLPSAAGPVEIHLVERENLSGPVSLETTSSVSASPATPSDTETETDQGSLEDLSNIEREAEVIAQRISEMVNGTPEERGPAFAVYDSDTKMMRPVRFRDIVILMRATTGRTGKILETLRRYDIPAYAETDAGYFQATEVVVMMSLLQIIDNPRQDIPLAAVLRSQLVGLDMIDLARLKAKYKARMQALSGENGKDNSGATLGGEEGLFDVLMGALDLDDPGVAPEALARLNDFFTRLDNYRTAARRGGLSRLIWDIYQETGYLDYVGGLPGGGQRQANLRFLHDKAREFDGFTRQGLSRFLTFFDDLQAAEGDFGEARALGENENVVRIMSIHKSKGLEFPVVFIANLGGQFNLADTKGDILLHDSLGIAAQFVDADLRLAYPTLPVWAARSGIKLASYAEELRVLYVGLTRARERLILVGSARQLEKRIGDWVRRVNHNGWPLKASDIYSASSFLDWVMPAVARHREGLPLRAWAVQAGHLPQQSGALAADAGAEAGVKAGISADIGTDIGTDTKDPIANDGSRWDLTFWGDGGLTAPEARALQVGGEGVTRDQGVPWQKILGFQPLGLEGGAVEEALSRQMEWSYPDAELTRVAAKISVTELKGRMEMRDAQLQEEAGGEDGTGKPRRGLEYRKPRFIEGEREMTAAEKGTATHLVMQYVDLYRSVDIESLVEQVTDLVERQVLTPEQAEVVDFGAIEGFFDTELGRLMLAQPGQVQREVTFSMGLPAQQVYPGIGSEDQVIVQGMVDCIITTPEGIIVLDFKTDRVPRGQAHTIAERYRSQLDLYSQAAQAAFGRPVVGQYLYLFSVGQTLQVE